jgi:hypothetical protein
MVSYRMSGWGWMLFREGLIPSSLSCHVWYGIVSKCEVGV